MFRGGWLAVCFGLVAAQPMKVSSEPLPTRFGDVPPTATIIPAPREMRVTGGEYFVKGEPRIEKVTGIPAEGYELSITPEGMTIRHSDEAGLFYARTTILHMGRYDSQRKCTAYPCLEIKDAPQFKWRGVHLDDARHFYGKDTVKRLLKQMAWFKFNVFHWHLTEDQAWTLEIPGYPELQRYGDEWQLPGRPPKCHGEKVAPGVYTAKDVKEIVEYAKSLHITVVPEIELPGHVLCALCAYPQFCCFPEQIYKRGRSPYSQGVLKEVLCVGNPEAIKFFEKVLDHVCEIFPSEVIHIGGDECPRDNWKKCPKCQAFIKEHGLKGVENLQPWMTRHFTEYLAKKGRRTMGWDEIFLDSSNRNAGGAKISTLLPKSTMGMCWRTHGAGAEAANRGYDIVLAPTSHCYFDYRQGLAEDPYEYIGGMLPLKKVYAFDPLAGVTPAARPHVVGGQCCNWSSHTFNRFDLEWKLWPRGFAMAEVLWTYPDPAKRDYEEFAVRAAEFRRRLIKSHVNCAIVPRGSDMVSRLRNEVR